MTPSALSSPLTARPCSLTRVTAPRTPVAALTVTGESTETPTAPSVTDVCTSGTRRSAYGVPLSRTASVCGGGVEPPHALTPTTTPVMVNSATVVHQMPLRRVVAPESIPLMNVIPSVAVKLSHHTSYVLST